MNVTDNLRSRFWPEWKTRADMAGLGSMFETAVSFFGAPRVKRSALEKLGTLNRWGVEEALRRELGKNVERANDAKFADGSRGLMDRRAARRKRSGAGRSRRHDQRDMNRPRRPRLLG
jgi:hypothetical protein